MIRHKSKPNFNLIIPLKLESTERPKKDISRYEWRVEKIEAKISHYWEKVALLELNFKTTMKDHVKYNATRYQLEIDKDFINQSTQNLKEA